MHQPTLRVADGIVDQLAQHRTALNLPPKPLPSGDLCNLGAWYASGRNDSHDRSPYRVWFDFRRGRESIEPAACGRQYWISDDPRHPYYQRRFVYLVNGQGKCVSPFLYIEKPDGSLTRISPAPECSPDSAIPGAW